MSDQQPTPGPAEAAFVKAFEPPPAEEPAAEEPAVEEPVAEEPAAAATEPDEDDDDWSDLFDDEAPAAEEPAKPTPAAAAKPAEKAEPADDELDIDSLDLDDPDVKRQILLNQHKINAELKQLRERDAKAALDREAEQQQAAEDGLADQIDAAVKAYQLTKPEMKLLVRYVATKGLETSLLSGKLTFDEVIGFADPSIKGRATSAPRPAAPRPAEGGAHKNGAKPAAGQPQAKPAPSNPAPSSTFADATAAARNEGWLARLAQR